VFAFINTSKQALIIFIVLLLMTFRVFAIDFSTKAKQAYLIDARTGTVLFAKNENDLIPPASLAKIMTMEVVFDALKKGEITLEDQYNVSEHAWRTGGAPSRTSTMFASLGSDIRVEDLIRGAIVQSGNDSCIILAEGMEGSEEKFAKRMTDRARELGLAQSVFANPTGLPHPEAKVTMKELVHLARHMYETYPDFYKYYAETEFTWNRIRQLNRAPLLNAGIGVDGLKTGFTEASGYGIVSSIEQNGQRLFLAMSGMKDQKQRISETKRILEWGLRNFQPKLIFADGETIGSASVYGGEGGQVDLVTKGDVDILLGVGNNERLKARIAYNWPLAAPVQKGDEVAEIRIWVGETLSRTAPLYAASNVEPGPLHRRAWDAFKEMLLFWL
jgi:D-alanyl-D-alanine carboxypeptidase (penicillin-binding protein 5/6)